MSHNVTARDVPELRADMVEDARWYKGDPGVSLDRWITSVEAAELFWVAQDMRQMAETAAESLLPMTMHAEDIPSPHGILVWEGTVHGLAGFSWSVIGGKVNLHGLVPRKMGLDRIQSFHEDNPERVKAFKEGLALTRSLLLPDMEQPVPLGEELTAINIYLRTMPVDEMDQTISVFLPTVALSLWLLMEQTLATREMVRPSRHGMKRLARLDAKLLMDTRYVTLRRTATNPTYGSGGGVQRSHRWVTRGHWRNVPYGPGKVRTRRTWIDPYISGPDGASILDPSKLVRKLQK